MFIELIEASLPSHLSHILVFNVNFILMSGEGSLPAVFLFYLSYASANKIVFSSLLLGSNFFVESGSILPLEHDEASTCTFCGTRSHMLWYDGYEAALQPDGLHDIIDIKTFTTLTIISNTYHL
jgi:hypothetical protein